MANEVYVAGSEAPTVRIVPHDDQMPPEAAFFLGLIVGALLTMMIGGWRRRGKALKAANARADAWRLDDRRESAEIAALARRTAALESIVTDPGHRVAAEIDGLK